MYLTAIQWAPDVNLGSREAYHCNFILLARRRGRARIFIVGDLSALTALELRVLSFLLLLLLSLLLNVALLKVDGRCDLGFIPLLFVSVTRLMVVDLNNGQLATLGFTRRVRFFLKSVKLDLAVAVHFLLVSLRILSCLLTRPLLVGKLDNFLG